jgi:hypothetical protein
MIKKLFVALLTVTALFFICCNDTKDSKTKDKNNEEEVSKDDDDKKVKDKDADELKEEESEEPKTNLDRAAVAYCDCYQAHKDEIPGFMSSIFRKAANDDEPVKRVQKEYQALDPAEREEYEKVMDKSSEVSKCFEGLKKKYDFNDDDAATLKKIKRKVDSQNGCAMISDILTISIADAEEDKKKTTNNE